MTDALVQFGWFRSHSGLQLPFKIDCDALSDETLNEFAKIVAGKFAFGHVVGVPRGGLRFAAALLPHSTPGYPLMIVDDVLTTGVSMERALADAREQTMGVGRTIGVVIFARAPCPSWVWPVFQVSEWAQSRGTGVG